MSYWGLYPEAPTKRLMRCPKCRKWRTRVYKDDIGYGPCSKTCDGTLKIVSKRRYGTHGV